MGLGCSRLLKRVSFERLVTVSYLHSIVPATLKFIDYNVAMTFILIIIIIITYGLFCIISQLKQDIGRKSRFFHSTPKLAFDALVRILP